MSISIFFLKNHKLKCSPNNFLQNLTFFSANNIRIFLFLIKYYIVKIDIIRNYLLANTTELKLCDQKEGNIAIIKKVHFLYRFMQFHF